MVERETRSAVGAGRRAPPWRTCEPRRTACPTGRAAAAWARPGPAAAAAGAAAAASGAAQAEGTGCARSSRRRLAWARGRALLLLLRLGRGRGRARALGVRGRRQRRGQGKAIERVRLAEGRRGAAGGVPGREKAVAEWETRAPAVGVGRVLRGSPSRQTLPGSALEQVVVVVVHARGRSRCWMLGWRGCRSGRVGATQRGVESLARRLPA